MTKLLLLSLFALSSPLGAGAPELPGGHGPEGAPTRFCVSTWADASGMDGRGGVALAVGLNSQGAKVLPLREDGPTRRSESKWKVGADEGEGFSYSFEWNWVTTPAEKHWGKTWAGAGIAFNKMWSNGDVSAARYLLLLAKTNAPEADLKLSLNSFSGGKTGRVSGLSLAEHAEGRKIGKDWTPVVIPLANFPGIENFDLKNLQTIGVDLAGKYPENERCFIRLADLRFSDSEILTGVDSLGWAVDEDALLLQWEKKDRSGVDSFRVTLGGKPGGTLPATASQARLRLDAFRKGPLKVGVAAMKGGAASAERVVEVDARPKARAEAAVSVDGAARHQVSRLIFGYNNMNAATLKGSGASVNRWGGNRKSKYNWIEDCDSAAADWYFLNEAASDAKTEEAKSYYRFAKESLAAGAEVNFTIPIGGWVARRPAPGQRLCSFPLSLYPQQRGNDGQGCGDGHLPDGSKIWGNDPALASQPSTPEMQKRWVETLVKHFGRAQDGGVEYYSMDNEPGLWADTHRDSFPKGIGYDEMARRNLEYARAVKQADPSAKVLGFVAWGVKELAGSNLDYYAPTPDGHRHPDKFSDPRQRWSDRRRHGDLPQAAWYLRQMREAERKEGRRLIDYFDFHWYPETYARDSKGGMQRLSNDLAFDEKLAPAQFEALREWVDASYVNADSWTANSENRARFWDPFHPVLPALKRMVAENYPGTRLAISEYDTGSRSYYHGALLRIVALGHFMDQGLDMANNWWDTDPSKFIYWANRLFMNYDGKGGNLLGSSVAARSGHPDLYSFATRRQGASFVVLVNKSLKTDLDTRLSLPASARSYQTFRIAESAGAGILAGANRAAQGRSIRLTVPAWSAMLVAIRH